MRLVRISLAAKYRMLFGLAVALIIAAALSVPWVRMEALLLDPPFREAQRAASDFFRTQLAQHDEADAVAGVHKRDTPLFPDRLHRQPVFVGIGADLTDPASPLAHLDNPLAIDALKNFRKHPKLDYIYRIEQGGEGRVFYYAHAVRVTRSCLDCHDEGKTARPYRENDLAGAILVDVPADLDRWQPLLNRAWVIAAGCLAGILAILVFYIITRRFILYPIHELREVTARVAQGDLEVRSSLSTGDEFEQLSFALNHMLERLRDSQEDLRRANRLLDQKLGEMAETNVALFEANRVKSEFIANVSHELRTPLTSIIGFAELLREGPVLDPNSRSARYAENILISGRILLEIINDLLDLAKIEAGRVELHRAPVAPRELCATLLDFMRPLADKKQITLEFVAAPELPTLLTDPVRLRQILFNLLSNAIKFTPDGGQVRLFVLPAAEGHVRIEVADTGPGIAAEHQQAIFEKFRQIDQSATREHAGTGLGLAIARELTMLLGGTIGVVSEMGHGAMFWVELPAEAPESAARALPALT